MPWGLKRFQEARCLHFVTFSCYRRAPLLGAAVAVQLPAGFPKDPADRPIAARAMVEAAPLVTADERIRGAKVVQTIW